MRIHVEQNSITVEAISGDVRESHFVLYLTLREKYADAEVVTSGSVLVVALRPGPMTLRTADDGVTPMPVSPNEPDTTVTIDDPDGHGLDAGVTASRYTACIIGLRHREEERLSPIPFTTTNGREQ